MEKYSAGENIESYCTKCKRGLDHAIVAMDGETILKVKCKTCGSAHKFRNPADPPKKARSPRTKKSDATKVSAETRWETSVADARGKEHVYTMESKFRIGDIVLHDRFGKGVVLKLYMNKCDVLFKDKERLMASAN